MNFYKRHIGDYARDTRHLTMLQHGAYNLLLDLYYARENGIPVDDVDRLIGARTPQEKRALETVLSDFFVRRDGLFFQKRCDREIEKMNEKASLNRRNGGFGGRPKTQTVSAAQASGNLTQTPDTRHQDSKSISPPSPPISNLRENERLNTATGEVTTDAPDLALQLTPPSPTPPTTRRPFKAPTLAEVIVEGARVMLPEEECEKFLDHHAARGWMSGRTKIVDWKRALNTWLRNFRSGTFNRGEKNVRSSGGKNGGGVRAEDSARREAGADLPIL